MRTHLANGGRDFLGDFLCGLGWHWPRAWEPSYEAGYEELLCQRDDCRHRLARRWLAPPPRSVSLTGVRGLRGPGGEG